jgi:hypothetical protein
MRHSSSRRPGRPVLVREALNRVGVVFGVIVGVALAGYLLAYRTSGGGLRLGSGAPRTHEERRALLSSGNCALRRDGAVLGHIIAVLPVGRYNPEGLYEVEAVNARETITVLATEVRVVPCHSIGP